MGATASVNSTDDFLSVAPPEFVLDEFTWINILHSWETAESFSSVSPKRETFFSDLILTLSFSLSFSL